MDRRLTELRYKQSLDIQLAALQQRRPLTTREEVLCRTAFEAWRHALEESPIHAQKELNNATCRYDARAAPVRDALVSLGLLRGGAADTPTTPHGRT